jgi:glycosyltransferase involved in cell wall biosynthesis
MTVAFPLSIVVPTRNRGACLLSLLETLERYHEEDGHRFQLIIADNSDDDSLRARIESSPLPIEYRYSPDVLSVVENFNRAVPFIRGAFACFMGDDDIVTSRVFELVDLMAREKIDAAIVSPAVKCLYFWPGVSHKRWGNLGGRLYVSRSTGEARSIDIRRVLYRNRLRISDGPQALPRAYFGVISKACIERVTSRYGALFGGVSPDIFSSRLLAEVVTSFVSVDLPFIAPGAAAASTSAMRAERADIGKLRDNDHTGRFKDLDWNARVPDFYAPFTVWAQSLLQAEKVVGTKLGAWAFPYLYAKCLLFSRGHAPSVRRALEAAPSPVIARLQTALSLPFVALEYALQKVPLLMHRAPGGAQDCLDGLHTSDAATRRLNSHIAAIPLRYRHARH